MHPDARMMVAALLASGLMAKGESNDEALAQGLDLADRLSEMASVKDYGRKDAQDEFHDEAPQG